MASTARAAGLGRAYVTDPFGYTVTVINTSTFEIVTVIPLGFLAIDATLSPDESVLYVTSEASVYVINTATNTVTTTIPVGDSPSAVAFTPDGTRAYVANTLSSTVSVINTATNTVVGTIPLAERSFPSEVAVSPNGTRAYVVNTGPNTVSVIDRVVEAVIATVNTSPDPIAPGSATAQAFLTVPGTYYWRPLYTGDANNNRRPTRATRRTNRWSCGRSPLPPSPGSSPATSAARSPSTTAKACRSSTPG